MKILLALGHCDEEVINIGNEILRHKIWNAAKRRADDKKRDDPRLSERTAAKMSGRPVPEVKPPNAGEGNEAKKLREKAKHLGREKRLLIWIGSMRRPCARCSQSNSRKLNTWIVFTGSCSCRNAE